MPNIDLSKHPQVFQDRPEQIWVVTRVGDEDSVDSAFATEDEAEGFISNSSDLAWGASAVEVTLHRQRLQPIYGGPTLLEALWDEMDRLMEGLMTGQIAEDQCKQKGYHGVPAPYDDFEAPCEHWENGDRYRAEELAWVLAIVTNAYNPDINSIRAEAMRRWNEALKQNEGADR